MNYATIVIYLFKSALAFTLLYSLYRVLLKKETFHGVNRVVLLFIMAASVTFPLIEFKTDNPNPLTNVVNTLEEEVITSEEYSNLLDKHQQRLIQWESVGITPVVETNLIDNKTLTLSKVIKWTVIVYVLIILILLGKYLLELISLWRLLSHSKVLPVNHLAKYSDAISSDNGRGWSWLQIKTLFNGTIPTSCSWMRWIVMNIPTEDKNFQMVHAHESSHVRLGHSWDMLFCDLITRLLWFLPFAWLLRRDLRDVHEYQADASVLKREYDAESYQLLLIRSAASSKAMAAANSFNSSAVKGRLKMMFRAPSSLFARTKILYLLPLFLLTATLVAKPTLIDDVEVIMTGAFSINPTERSQMNSKTVDVRLIETARMTLDEFMEMPCKYDIDQQKDKTLITLYRFVKGKDEIIAFNKEAYTIYDEETGDRYMCRGIEGYGDEVNINLKNYQMSVVPFTLVFPPLKKDVSTIRLLSGETTVSDKPFKIDDIRHKSYRIIR